MRNILPLAAVLPMVMAVPAIAGPGEFQTCDGYPAPTKKIDGMTKGTWLFGLASRAEDIRRRQFNFGAPALNACDVALTDPLLLPTYWLRRSHLLQAKAMHQLDTGDAEGAIATLALSDAAAPAKDLFFDRSVGLGNRALRAIALFKLGKPGPARAELDAIEAERPYAAAMRDLTLTIRLANEPNREAQRRLMRQNMPFSPTGMARLFWVSMYYSDFKAAADIGQEVSFDLPHGRDDWQISGYAAQKYEAIGKRADLAGGRAYALAAIGRADEARALLVAADADLAEVMAPLPPLATDQKYSKNDIRAHDSRVAAGESGVAKLERWKKLIALRARVSTMTIDLLRGAIDIKQDAAFMVLPDLMAHLKVASTAEGGLRDNAVNKLYAGVDAMLAKGNLVNGAAIVEMMPRPETATMVPAFKPTGDGYFLSDLNGFYTKRDSDPRYLNIRYGGYLSDRATIEELALLAAAQQARKAGKDSFLVDSRLFIEKSLTFTGMYSSGATINNGYEARIRIMVINAADLPRDLEHSRWRLIRVDTIEQSLGRIYSRPSAAAK